MLARCYVRRNQTVQATGVLRDVLHDHPDSAIAWMLMARIAIDIDSTAGVIAVSAAPRPIVAHAAATNSAPASAARPKPSSRDRTPPAGGDALA